MCTEIISTLYELESQFTPRFDFDDENSDEAEDDIPSIVTQFIQEKPIYTDHQTRLFKDYLFNSLDIMLMIFFTGRDSTYINRRLAYPGSKKNPHQQIIIDEFDKTLSKIPRYTNEIVYRIDNYDRYDNNEKISFYRSCIGNVINIPWFLSTTCNPSNWPLEIVWKIKILDNGHTKARVSYPLMQDHGNEHEIRFERNVMFRVNSIKESESICYINMVEVDDVNYDIEFADNSIYQFLNT